MRKIKIFYLTTGLAAGGAEIMLTKIISRLNKDQYDIVVCSLTNTPYLINTIRNEVKKSFMLNFENSISSFLEFLKLRRIIKKENPDILHCFMVHANLIGRLVTIGLKCKVISSIRVKLINQKFLIFLDRLTQRFAECYMVNSNTLKEFVGNYGIKKKKIVLIQNGVDFDEIKTSPELQEELKKSLDIKKSKIITMVANLRKQKDYPTMLKAITLLRSKNDITFLSCGSGTIFEDESDTIMTYTKKLNLENVKFLGFRQDIPDILAITDIWVSSTLYEGQSNSLLEAMAMKKPIVTTNIPENAEVVRNEKEALLVPVKNPLKMAQAINKLIENEDLAEKLATNAYNRVLQKYNINNTIQRLERLYQSILR